MRSSSTTRGRAEAVLDGARLGRFLRAAGTHERRASASWRPRRSTCCTVIGDPQAGTIRLDGADLRRCRSAPPRGGGGEPDIRLRGTLAENIRCRRAAGGSRAAGKARRAHLDAFDRKPATGLETASASAWSAAGGQRQRSRSRVRREPCVPGADEATPAVRRGDRGGDHRRGRCAFAGRTRISHRAATLAGCDLRRTPRARAARVLPPAAVTVRS